MPDHGPKKATAKNELPVTVLVGKDSFIASMKLDEIRQKYLEGADPSMAVQQYDGEKADFDDIAVDLATPSLFAAKKLVVITDAEKLLNSQAEKILTFLEQPPAGSHTVFITPALDQRRKLGKLLAQAGRVIHCDGIASRDLPGWAAARARHYGKRLDSQALTLLVALSGDQAGRIDAELVKLAVYTGTRQTISAEDVQALAVGSRSFKYWELTEAIGAGDRAKALQAVVAMLDDGANEILLVIMLGRHIEDLIAAVSEPGRLDRIPMRFVREKIEKQARKFTLEKLQLLYAQVHRADVDLKSSRLESRTIVEMLVARLAS